MESRSKFDDQIIFFFSENVKKPSKKHRKTINEETEMIALVT